MIWNEVLCILHAIVICVTCLSYMCVGYMFYATWRYICCVTWCNYICCVTCSYTSRKYGKKEPQSFSHCGSFDHPGMQSLNCIPWPREKWLRFFFAMFSTSDITDALVTCCMLYDITFVMQHDEIVLCYMFMFNVHWLNVLCYMTLHVLCYVMQLCYVVCLLVMVRIGHWLGHYIFQIIKWNLKTSQCIFLLHNDFDDTPILFFRIKLM